MRGGRRCRFWVLVRGWRIGVRVRGTVGERGTGGAGRMVLCPSLLISIHHIPVHPSSQAIVVDGEKERRGVP